MRKTHFEQIPMEVIKEIVEENARQKKIRADEAACVTKKKDVEAEPFETTTASACGERV
jgi:hypothetical protein